MLSTAIVIFRESLEISLIFGIILAATRGLPNRLYWILGGAAAGTSGAGLVAVFADEISNAASGVGQELFNAGILFTAALFIGWTVLWMRKHAREMSAKLRQVGQDVTAGKLPHYSLAAVIGLAMLREGSEIVLFIYGMFASGETVTSVVSGSLLGVVFGTATGVCLYFGLIRMSPKYMLQVTSWVLMLLVAGLAAQGVGFLTQAGYFDGLSRPVWDTSWLLSDGSLIGKALHSLVGYCAKPSSVQLLAYGVTLSMLAALVAVIDGKLRRGTLAVAVTAAMFVALLIKATPAFALDDIHSPNITKSEVELEYNASTTVDNDSAKNNAQEHELELEYAPADHWKTEFSMAFTKEPGADIEADSVAWENFFQFWDQGEKWVDAGLQVAYGHAIHNGDADSVEAKLLLEKQQGKFLHRANIGFEQEVGSDAAGGPDFVVLWSSRYRLGQHFEPGFEIQSDLGADNTLGRFRDQEHYVGPAAYGEIVKDIKYEAAYLFGVSDAAADGAARLKLEYETVF